MSSSDLIPSLRYRGGDDHHLWRKGRNYFVRYSVSAGNEFKAHRRICRSLGTTDLRAARVIRDQILARLPALAGHNCPLRAVPRV
jgi:hypothetical protein